MDEINKIIQDETLSPEQKADKIKQINVDITNKAIQERVAREKASKEKLVLEAEQNKTNLEERINQLEKERNTEKERYFKNKYKDNYLKALEKANKGYEEEDLDKLFEIKSESIKDFKENKELTSKTDTSNNNETDKSKKDLDDIIKNYDEWEKKWK